MRQFYKFIFSAKYKKMPKVSTKDLFPISAETPDVLIPHP